MRSGLLSLSVTLFTCAVAFGCGGHDQACRVGADCASGQCLPNGFCADGEGAPDGGSGDDGGDDDGMVALCDPNHDGTVARDEVTLGPNLTAPFRVATSGGTVDTAGTPAMDGSRAWI